MNQLKSINEQQQRYVYYVIRRIKNSKNMNLNQVLSVFNVKDLNSFKEKHFKEIEKYAIKNAFMNYRSFSNSSDMFISGDIQTIVNSLGEQVNVPYNEYISYVEYVCDKLVPGINNFDSQLSILSTQKFNNDSLVNKVKDQRPLSISDINKPSFMEGKDYKTFNEFCKNPKDQYTYEQLKTYLIYCAYNENCVAMNKYYQQIGFNMNDFIYKLKSVVNNKIILDIENKTNVKIKDFYNRFDVDLFDLKNKASYVLYAFNMGFKNGKMGLSFSNVEKEEICNISLKTIKNIENSINIKYIDFIENILDIFNNNINTHCDNVMHLVTGAISKSYVMSLIKIVNPQFNIPNINIVKNNVSSLSNYTSKQFAVYLNYCLYKLKSYNSMRQICAACNISTLYFNNNKSTSVKFETINKVENKFNIKISDFYEKYDIYMFDANKKAAYIIYAISEKHAKLLSSSYNSNINDIRISTIKDIEEQCEYKYEKFIIDNTFNDVVNDIDKYYHNIYNIIKSEGAKKYCLALYKMITGKEIIEEPKPIEEVSTNKQPEYKIIKVEKDGKTKYIKRIVIEEEVNITKDCNNCPMNINNNCQLYGELLHNKYLTLRSEKCIDEIGI